MQVANKKIYNSKNFKLATLFSFMQPQSSPSPLIAISPTLPTLYPHLPKYASDPQQSQIIRTYDTLLKRYQGLYGHMPKYYVKVPIFCPLLGSQATQRGHGDKEDGKIGLGLIGFCGGKNVIVVVGVDGNDQTNGDKQVSKQKKVHKIRINHFQNAVFSQKVFQSSDPTKWKYEQSPSSSLTSYSSSLSTYNNILTSILKIYSTSFLSQAQAQKGLPPLNLLIYQDFVQDQFVYSKEAFVLAVAIALHVGNGNGKDKDKEKDGKFVKGLDRQFCRKFLEKVAKIIPEIRSIDYLLYANYNNFTHFPFPSSLSSSYIPSPSSHTLILAHSLTPLPKKLTLGRRSNLRLCQLQIALQILKIQLGITSSQVRSIQDLMNESKMGVEEILDALQEYVPQGDVSAEKIQEITGKGLIEILREIPYANNVVDENLTFKPYNRMKFCLLDELLIQKVLKNPDPKIILQSISQSYKNSIECLQIGSEQITKMIALLQKLSQSNPSSSFESSSASQAILSSPSDIVYKILGQGWGGYLLIFCKKGLQQKILQSLVEQFYASQENKMFISDDLEIYINVMEGPGTGIGVLDPQGQIWFC